MSRRNANTSLTNILLRTPVIFGAAPTTTRRNSLYPTSFSKGWIETSGGGAWTIDDSLNVTSITDNAAGDFTINWTTAWANANYSVCGTPITTTGQQKVKESTATAKSTTVVRVEVITSGVGNGDPTTGVSVIAVGDQ